MINLSRRNKIIPNIAIYEIAKKVYEMMKSSKSRNMRNTKKVIVNENSNVLLKNEHKQKLYTVLITFALFISLFHSIAIVYAASSINVYSTKSGWITEKNTSASYINSRTDNQTLQYFGSNGYKAYLSSVQYEWFNLSTIPVNATILSAKLYKFSASQRMGADWNALMSPSVYQNSSRVTLGKLLENFNQNDSFWGIGLRFRNQQILNKVDRATTLTTDNVIEFNVTDVVQKWVSGEPNYGFSFLGNFNVRGDTGTRYYFSNASQQYRPYLSIEYTLASCGNGIVENRTGEECDDGNHISNDGCSSVCKIEKCGDGIVQTSESCEYPNTLNNLLCTQANLTCSGTNRTAVRDNYGNCGSNCQCNTDPVNYQCLKGSCGATCSIDSDCNDNNSNTVDTCDLNSCGCKFTYIPKCGNGIIDLDLNESCELNNTANNSFCTQTNSTCVGNQTGLRDNFGNCNSACGCVLDNYNYQCVIGSCGASCSANSDCNDNNSNTIDTCDLNTCSCKNTYQGSCGNGIVDLNLNETCELPNSINNTLCEQSNLTCLGNQTGSRDNFGNCNSICGCTFDSFQFSCIIGSCGASCGSNEDCGINQCSSSYQDECIGTKLIDYNNDNTQNTYYVNATCENSCSANSCSCSTCNVNCEATAPAPKCIAGSCGASCGTDIECNDNNADTEDKCDLSSCSCTNVLKPYCGNGFVDIGSNETCELPNTANNIYCVQSRNECSGNKTGNRDFNGDCNANCGCVLDNFNYTCIRGSCGAACGTDSDCDDSNTDTIDTCSQDTCSCRYTNINNCGNSILDSGEQCDDGNIINGDGCSSICLIESRNITYVVPYVGDIDGAVSSTWYHFYLELATFLDSNKINSTISFFPGTMVDDNTFKNAFIVMHNSKYIEMIQKGYDGGANEFIMETLNYSQQRSIITAGSDAYTLKMKSYLSSNSVKSLRTYDQIGSRVNNITAKVLEDLGYYCYFDVYYAPDLIPLQPSAKLDVIQYGVGFSDKNAPNMASTFRNSSVLIAELKNYSRNDVPIMRINGNKVVPLWIHQQDFENMSGNGAVNSTKWNIFTKTLLDIKNDSSFVLITAEQLYKMAHVINDSNQSTNNSNLSSGPLCQYATSATATSENALGSFASYAVGRPDVTDSSCTSWNGYGRTWSPSNWNVKANLTVTYAQAVNVSNLTIFGDYDICYSAVWLKNTNNGQIKQVLNTIKNDCNLVLNDSGNFLADSIIIQTCGWAWSSTDAVQICGNGPSLPANITINNTGNISASVCLWEGCKKGALSVSVDDGFTSCRDELDAHNFKGTYYLSDTNTYSSSEWNTLNNMFISGHEIGTHMQDHLCYELTAPQFQSEIQNNINDIVSHTSVKQSDIITHAYPCGAYFPQYATVFQNNWNFVAARGYNFNQPDFSTPQSMWNLKSFNSHEYPGGDLEPPNYFTAVDNLELTGDWLNLVFHIDCSDDGVIDYLPGKNIWVDTVGNVARYIKLRDSATISNFVNASNKIEFMVQSPLTQTYYKHNLTMKVNIPSMPNTVRVNGVVTSFELNTASGQSYITFDVPFPINNNVSIAFN